MIKQGKPALCKEDTNTASQSEAPQLQRHHSFRGTTAEWNDSSLVEALRVVHANFHRHALEEGKGLAAQVGQTHAAQVHYPDGCTQRQRPWVQYLPDVLLHKAKMPADNNASCFCCQQPAGMRTAESLVPARCIHPMCMRDGLRYHDLVLTCRSWSILCRKHSWAVAVYDCKCINLDFGTGSLST